MIKYILFLSILSISTLLHAKIFNHIIDNSTTNNARYMSVNTDMLTKVDSLEFLLSETLMYRFEKVKLSLRGTDNYTWFGHGVENSADTVIITVMGKKVLLKCTIGNMQYYLRQVSDDRYILKQTNPDAILKPFLDDMIVEPSSSARSVSQRASINQRSVDENDPVSLKLLILYTKEMLTYYGNNLDITIQSLVDVANLTHSNSETFVTLEIADKQLLDSTYTSESYTIETALSQLSANDDLEIDKKRKLASANIVTLLRRYKNSGTCGLAPVLLNIETNNKTNAYSVVEVKSSDEGAGYYCADHTLVHEIGHNMGCTHDRDHSNFQGLFDYSYGFDIAGTLATVMSYDSPQIPYFSNPNILYNGHIIGSSEGYSTAADCAKTIRKSKGYLATNLEFKESVEATDSQDNNYISGALSSQEDRDSYDVNLNGSTTFTVSNNYYSNFTMYLNIYNAKGILISASDVDANSLELTLSEGIYTLVVSYYNDESTSYYSYKSYANEYTINITTEASVSTDTPVDTSSSVNNKGISGIFPAIFMLLLK